MISSEEFFNSVRNSEEISELSDDDGWGSDFDDPITELYSQEIEENRINEKREAVLSKIGNNANSMEEPSTSTSLANENSATTSPSNTGALLKTGFSYLVGNNSPKTQEHQITSPSFEHKIAINTISPKDGEITDVIVNASHSLDSNDKSTNLKQQDSSSQASSNKKVPGKLRPEAFDFLKKLKSPEILRTDDVNEYLKLENTETLLAPPPLPARPPPVFKYPSLNFSKQTAEFRETVLDLVNENAILQHSDVNDTIESQNEEEILAPGNVDNETNVRNLVSNEVRLKNQLVEPQSEVVPQPFNKRPISIPINKSLRSLLENADHNLKNYAQTEITKTEPEHNVDVANNSGKPELPKKPEKFLNQHLEQNIIKQHNSNIRLPARKSVAVMETKIIDVPGAKITTCESEIPLSDSMKDYSKSRRSLIVSPDNSRLDSPKIQITNLSNENEDDKLQMHDFDPWQHAMDRPSLPQKLRGPQRSLSCNSLVQSFKDLSLAIWFPPEKEKRSSVASSNVKIPRKISKEDLITPPICLSTPPVIEESALPEEKDLTPMEQASITRNLWYHEVDASEAQRRLLKLDLDGAFLVRPSSRPTSNVHYTVSVTHSGRVLNTHIREKNNGHYAIGKEKEDEKTFSSISELIKYYQDVPFKIRPSGSSTSYGICFRITPPR